MSAVAKRPADALALSEAEREDLAAQLLDSLEPPPGISVEDHGRTDVAEAHVSLWCIAPPVSMLLQVKP